MADQIKGLATKDAKPVKDAEEQPQKTVTVAEQKAAGVPADQTVPVADQKAGAELPDAPEDYDDAEKEEAAKLAREAHLRAWPLEAEEKR